MFHWGVCRCFSDSFIISILSWGVGDTVRYPQLLLKTQCSGCFLHQSSESEFLTYVCRLRARSFVWHKNPSTLCVFCTPQPNRKTACGSCGFTFLFSAKLASQKYNFRYSVAGAFCTNHQRASSSPTFVGCGLAPSFGTKIPPLSAFFAHHDQIAKRPAAAADLHSCLVCSLIGSLLVGLVGLVGVVGLFFCYGC